MNWADYQVGRRVVCIRDSSEHWRLHCSIWPVLGRVYTIKASRMGANEHGEELLGLRFEEFESYSISEFRPEDGYWWFPARSFRPLDERRLDQFRQLLTPAPKARAPA